MSALRRPVPRPRRPDLAALAVAVAAAACSVVSVRIPGDDMWWQVAYGRFILAHRALPVRDTFSWTAAGHPLVVTEWAFDALQAAAARLGPGAAFALALGCLFPLGAAAAAVCARRARSRTVGALLAVLVLGLLLPAESLLPELGSYALFAATLWVLERARLAGPRWLAALPPLFALWANVHGSFPIGLGPVALDALLGFVPRLPGRLRHRCRRSTRRWLPAALAASAAATLANPYGWRLWPYVVRLAASPFHLAYIAEFQSPNFHDLYFGRFILPAVALGVAAVAGGRRELPARDAVAAGVLLAGTLVMVRMLPYAAIALAVLVASAVRVRRRPFRPAPWAVVALCAAAAVTAVGREMPGRWPSAVGQPVAAAAFVRDHLSGRGFNTYAWGSYLAYVWDGHPGVYVDSRGDMYQGTGVLRRYVAVVDVRTDPAAALERQGVAWALLPAGTPLAVALAGEGWTVAFAGGLAVVLVAPGS